MKKRYEDKAKIDHESFFYGKLPPQAIEVEETIIAAILLNMGSMDEIADILKPEMFYKNSYSDIYESIYSLYSRNDPIDISTVMEELRKKGKLDSIGGHMAILEIMDSVSVVSSMEYHARIIAEKSIRRSMIMSSSETIKQCYSDETDILDIISNSDKEMDSMLSSVTAKSFSSNADLSLRVINELKSKLNPVDGITGIPSGLSGIDRITGGWQNTDLIIIAARPAMGKSAFVSTIAHNAAKLTGKTVAFFSLEMSEEQLMNRQLSLVSEISMESFRKRKFNQYEISKLEAKQKEIAGIPILWDDTPALNVFEFRAKCRRLKQKNNLGLIIVDYLQLMTGGQSSKNGNREQEIGIISRTLKSVAKELNVPVIALSQLSRAVDARGSKKPVLSDLRESGSIEQDADMVCFIHRPEYYGDSSLPNGSSSAGYAEFIISKHRNGEIEDVEMKFIGKFTKFTDPVHETEQISLAYNQDPDDNPF